MAIIEQDGESGKVCNRCGEWKDVNCYSRQSANLRKGGDGYHYTCKVCHNQERREQRALNIEAARAKARIYYARNTERVKANVAAYRLAHPERVKASHKAYYERNRDIRRAKQRVRNMAYRADQGDRVRAYFRSYSYRLRREDPIRARRLRAKHERRRRALKANAEGFHTEAEWENLKAHFDYHCLRCGRREPEIKLTRDHVVPLSEGGSDYISNIQPLCAPYNSTKSGRFIDYRPLWEACVNPSESEGR